MSFVISSIFHVFLNSSQDISLESTFLYCFQTLLVLDIGRFIYVYYIINLYIFIYSLCIEYIYISNMYGLACRSQVPGSVVIDCCEISCGCMGHTPGPL